MCICDESYVCLLKANVISRHTVNVCKRCCMMSNTIGHHRCTSLYDESPVYKYIYAYMCEKRTYIILWTREKRIYVYRYDISKHMHISFAYYRVHTNNRRYAHVYIYIYIYMNFSLHTYMYICTYWTYYLYIYIFVTRSTNSMRCNAVFSMQRVANS